MKKTVSTALAIVCGFCFLFNIYFFLTTGNFAIFFVVILTGTGMIVNAINALSEDYPLAESAATIVRLLPKQQLVCSYCGKHQVSGLENCPHCGAAYNE